MSTCEQRHYTFSRFLGGGGGNSRAPPLCMKPCSVVWYLASPQELGFPFMDSRPGTLLIDVHVHVL